MSRRERFSPRRLRSNPQRSVTLFPRRTLTSLEEEAVKDLFNNAMLKRQRTMGNSKLISDVNNFMRDLRQKTYVPTALTGMDTSGTTNNTDDMNDYVDDDDDDE